MDRIALHRGGPEGQRPSGCATRVGAAQLLMALALVLPTHAHGWTADAQDNGMWFTAWANSPDRSFGFYCGGPSPSGQPLPQTDEPLMTEPYEMMIVLNIPALGRGTFDTGPRSDLIIAGATARYGLGETHWDLMSDSGWQRSLPFGSPLFTELAQSGAIAVDAGTTRVATISAPGLPEALTKTVAYCVARWTQVGETAPANAAPLLAAIRSSATPEPVANPSDNAFLSAAADAFIRQGCNGAYSTTPEYLLSGNIDGDGVDDLVVDWNHVTCSGQFPRPFCGAANCSGSVFLSRLFPSKNTPEDLLGTGFSLVRLSNGSQGVATVMTSGVCFENPKSCEFLFYWNGTNLVDLPR